MARVIFGDRQFESIRSESWNEIDYESIVISNAATLFAQWIVAPFKADIVGEDGSVHRPDLALIDRSYRRWCVVEVELAHHSLVAHVLPQVSTFATGSYGDYHAEYLSEKNPELDLARLRAMMLGDPPEILVVVDRPDTTWKRVLNAMDVSLSIVEPFRGRGDELLLRVNGEVPDLPGDVLSRLVRHDLRRLWSVRSPASLPEPSREDGFFEISFEGSTTLWTRTELNDSVMLSIHQGGDVLRGWRAVDLIRHDDNSLSIQPVLPER